MSTLQDFVKQMHEWPVSVLVVVVLNFVGGAIKRSDVIPNRIIPLALMVLGAGIYISVGDLGSVSFTTRNPGVVLGLYGGMLGTVAWMAHNVIWRQVTNKFPELKNGDGDTTHIEKPK